MLLYGFLRDINLIINSINSNNSNNYHSIVTVDTIHGLYQCGDRRTRDVLVIVIGCAMGDTMW